MFVDLWPSASELCGLYNKLKAKKQEMDVYINFNCHCRNVEELIHNMVICGPDFVTKDFEKKSQEILGRSCRAVLLACRCW